MLPGKEMKIGAKSSANKQTTSPLLNDPRWASLSKRERDFVLEINMRPTSYCNIKRQIQLEVVKNK